MRTSRLQSTSDPAVVRMRSPGEIVSAAPILLGFTPADSLVLICLRDTRLGLTCRIDLADVADDELISDVTAAVRRNGATSVILIAYGLDRALTEPALVRMRTVILKAGIKVKDDLSVVDGRWFHEGCTEARCCPSQGTPVSDHDEAPTTMALAAAKGGHLASREELVALVAPDRPLLRTAIAAALDAVDPAEVTDENVAADLTAILGWGDGQEPTPHQLARSMIACVLPEIRDTWYALVAPGMLLGTEERRSRLLERLCRAGAAAGDLSEDGFLKDPEARERILGRIRQWVRNLPDSVPGFLAGPLAVAATAHWCAGDGALARELVERAGALDAAPLSVLVTLQSALQHGVRPPEVGWLSDDIVKDRRRRRVA